MQQQAFRRLMEREALDGADAAAIAAATFRVLERLTRQLTPIIGPSGVVAVYARGVHLAKRQFPWLPPVSAVESDGSFADVRLSMQKQDARVATEAAFAVLIAISDLLESFIGESLTSQLLSGAWPDDPAGDVTRETAR